MFDCLISFVDARSASLCCLEHIALNLSIGHALMTVDQDIRLLDSALFIGFVVKHPIHHSFAVILQGDNDEAH